jgi:hypothetical protein
MFNTAGKREHALEVERDIALNLFRRHARVKRRDHDDRNIHRWKHVDRHSKNGNAADQRDYEADNNNKIGCFDGEAGQMLTPLLRRAVFRWLLGSVIIAAHKFGLHGFARLQACVPSEDNQLGFLQAGADFLKLGCL